jgi:glutathione S-transferase
MTKSKIESQPKLKLFYFNIKGKGEPIRLLCAYAGLELEDYRFNSYAEFLEMKQRMAFGQVPLLEVDNGDGEKHQLVQSASILTYLAKIAGLYPEKDHLLAAKVDAALVQESDAFTGTTVATYTKRFGIVLDEEKSWELINKEVLPRHLASVEALLGKSPTGWIAGTQEPSPPDFVWFSKFVDYLPNTSHVDPAIKSLDGYPKCQAFVQKFKDLGPIQEYYKKETSKA